MNFRGAPLHTEVSTWNRSTLRPAFTRAGQWEASLPRNPAVSENTDRSWINQRQVLIIEGTRDGEEEDGHSIAHIVGKSKPGLTHTTNGILEIN